MRLIPLLLFLIITSCKNDIKTGNKIDKTVYEIWNDFTKSNPKFKKDELPDSYFFHTNEAAANRLAELIVNGKKKAGSNLYFWYEEAKADLPKVGTKSIITNFDGKARAIIEIKKVDTIPFNQISKEYAELDMGTTMNALEKWKKAHWDFFKNAMEETGKEPTEEMLIVCETFETIWAKKQDK
ncbi:ASCH domain-containing protein [Aquimarina addita]|uniref:ASCH domain-containing protein n=1 Tax=Aquimarina addita TaxID=870485 RepID=A0ABP6UWY6_9FLAO